MRQKRPNLHLEVQRAHQLKRPKLDEASKNLRRLSEGVKYLSPPQTPTTFVEAVPVEKTGHVTLIGPYAVRQRLDANLFEVYDEKAGCLKLCRELSPEKYRHFLDISARLWECEEEEEREVLDRLLPSGLEVVQAEQGVYQVFPKSFGNLHVHVQQRKFLEEAEAKRFYRQIAELTAYCHSRNILLRDLKLRKFVFADEARSQLRLENLDDAVLCHPEVGDRLSDRHGCPAYVAPEVIDLELETYSGKAADVWSLGVVLFVMLLGRYPFFDQNPAQLFAKIRQAQLCLPPKSLSPEARLLIRGLLRKNPAERPNVGQLCRLPWLQSSADACPAGRRAFAIAGAGLDQVVPVSVGSEASANNSGPDPDEDDPLES